MQFNKMLLLLTYSNNVLLINNVEARDHVGSKICLKYPLKYKMF